MPMRQHCADAVTPNSVVLDIGAGTGIFALLACRYGARRVYAVEPDDAINLAREVAAANGYSDRLTLHSESLDQGRLCPNGPMSLSRT